MSQLFTGSICLTDLGEQAKRQHSGIVKGKNGKLYANIKIWLNDEPDRYGNDGSLQLNSSQEKRDEEGKIYIGNIKKLQKPGGSTFEEPDLPF